MVNSLIPPGPRPGMSLEALNTQIFQRQTLVNLAYLLLAFPLGLAYFVFLVTSIVVGAGLLIIWIGLPILVGVMYGWLYLATFERRLVIQWLKIPVRPLSLAAPSRATIWQDLRERLSNPLTWKALAFIFLKFPLGILVFVLLTSGLALSVLCLVILVLALIASPFVYLAALFSSQHPGLLVARFLRLALTGFGALALLLYVLNLIAWSLGQLAAALLGMSDKDLRLAEARKLVEREQARAARADQVRKELIVNVSHELRTPVASIRGHVESLLMTIDADAEEKEQKLTPEDLRPYLNIVHREVERLGSLVDDLLSIARTEADELRLKLEPVAADEVAREVYQALAPLARRERQVTLVCAVAPTDCFPRVLADRQRLGQVLLNLARNAITYTPQGGLVSIAMELPDPQHVLVSVTDTGIGIAPEELAQVFERFYRTDASRTRTSGGFGLGLAIVRDLVHAMGGVVQVESKVNEGSCFRVVLKVA